MIRRGILLAALSLAVAAGVALARPAAEPGPVATVGHATRLEATTTTTAMTVPAPAPAAPTTTVPKGATTRSTSLVRIDAGGVTVVNEGSASASTGGNVVVGPPSATVTEGPVSAVGNVADVRIGP